MRIVTWNVQGMAPRWRARRSLITQALRSEQPDVVALQECAWRLRHQSTQLGARLDMNASRSGTLGLLSHPPARIDVRPLKTRARGGSKRALLAEVAGVRVAVVHLPLDQKVRALFAERFVVWAGESPGPFVLCGDFNERPDGPVRSLLIDRGFTDAWTGDGGETWPAGSPRARIDFIMLHGPVRGERCAILPVAGSDHYGLVADIRPL